MKNLSIKLVVSMLSLWIVSMLMDSMHIDSLKSLLLLSIVLGFLNVFIKPIMKLFAFPITLLSFGLFSLVINGVVLKIAFSLIPGVILTGFISAILASILLSITNCILSNILD